MSIAFVLIGYGILFLIEGYPLAKGYKEGKPLPYIALLSSSLLLSILMTLNVKIPSPAVGIKNLIMMIIGE